MFGYLEFAALLFFPGFAILIVTKQMGPSVVSALVRSYGLSLAINAVVVWIASTYGVARIQNLPSLILTASSMVIILKLMIAHREVMAIRNHVKSVTKETAFVLLVGAIFIVVVFSHFLMYSIFPRNGNSDFLFTLIVTKDVLHGGVGGIGALLYDGVYYNMGLGLVLVGGNQMTRLSVISAILFAPLSLVVYETIKLVFKSHYIALLGQVIFVVTGYAWYIPLFNSSLYPSLFGSVLSLVFLIELYRILEGRGIRRFITFVLILFGLYLSHYFALAFVAAVVVALLVALVLRVGVFKNVLCALCVIVVPAIVAVVIRPDFVGSILSVLNNSSVNAGFFTYSTPQSAPFDAVPFLRYMVDEIYNPSGLLFLLVVPIAVCSVIRNRNALFGVMTMVVWFSILWFTTPTGEVAWRWSLQALVPVIILAPATFLMISRFVTWLLPDLRRVNARRRRIVGGRNWFIIGMTVFLVLIVSSGSWTFTSLYDTSTKGTEFSSAQQSLYDSMIWFSNNTPDGSGLIGVTDWRVGFMKELTGRVGVAVVFASATQAILEARANKMPYILVSYSVPSDVPIGFNATTYFGSFSNNPNLVEIYRNQYDVIYQVRSAGQNA